MLRLKETQSASNALHRLKWMLLCASIVATAGLNGCGSLLFSQDQKPEGTAIQMCRSWRDWRSQGRQVHDRDGPRHSRQQ